MKKFAAASLVLLAALCLSGCGGAGSSIIGGKAYVPVEGTVLLNEKPLDGAQVLFRPDPMDPKIEDESLGTTDASGKFTIKTGKKDGCPVGHYRVAVSKQDGENEMFPQYCRPIDSGLVVDVAEGMESPTFKLKN